MEKLKYKECENCEEWAGMTGITHCMNICGKPLDALKEFNEYKTLEEQNRLLKLPCAVRDTVYAIYSISESRHIVYDFEIDALHLVLNVMNEEFGKTVFLTREEAEAALKE